jgi:hypothetical protein
MTAGFWSRCIVEVVWILLIPFPVSRKRKDSISTSGTGDSFAIDSAPVTTPISSEISERSLEQAVSSSDGVQSVAFSNFTAPTFMLTEEDESSNNVDSTELGIVETTIALSSAISEGA